MSRIGIIILGCGQRAEAYASFFARISAEQACLISIVAIAEPVDARREAFATRYHVPKEHCFTTYEQLCASLDDGTTKLARCASAALICTQDAEHLACIHALCRTSIGQNLHILCEKPLAGTREQCLELERVLRRAWAKVGQRLFAVGHVLRYNAHNQLLKHLVSSGIIGDLLYIQHTEPVGHAHFAHSYVRGHWRRSRDASSSLLAKCCHDIDLVHWLVQMPGVQRQPSKVASLGNLSHFHRRSKPVAAGSVTRCLECPLVETCAYSAKKIYLDSFLKHGELRGYQKAILQSDVEDVPSIMEALNTSPYGRCVYECDNDVCDVQSVLLSYPRDKENGDAGVIQVSLSMISTTEAQCVRKTNIYGSAGEIRANGHDAIEVINFESGSMTHHDVETFAGTKESNAHGGGDYGLISQFIKAVLTVQAGTKGVIEAQDSLLGCSLSEIVNSHLLVFAAEDARFTSSVVAL